MIAAVLALCMAAPAVGAGPWSDPQTVPGGYLARWESPAGGSLQQVPGLFDFTPGGSGFAVLGDGKGGQGFTTFDGASQSLRLLRSSTFGGVAPQLMALYGREAVVLAGGANAPGDPHSQFNTATLLDAAATRGSVGGRFTSRQVLVHGAVTRIVTQAATVTALAANPAGDAAVVVAVPVRGHAGILGFRLRLFIRRHGQSSFRKVADFGRRTTGRSPAALALNGTGDVLMAWDDRVSVRAVVVSANGKVGAEQRLGQGGSAWIGASRMSASIDGTRRMLVAWLAQRVGEGSYAGRPGIVAYAYASPHKRFGAAKVVQSGLPQGYDRGIGAPGVVATLLRRNALVTWTGYAAGRYAVRAVDVTSGRPSAPTELSPPGTDAYLNDVAVGPRGGLVVTWSSIARAGTTPAPPAGAYARARAADSTVWGAVETLATMGTGSFLPGGVPVAADPVSGRAVALWSDPVVVGPPAALVTHSSVRSNPDAG